MLDAHRVPTDKVPIFAIPLAAIDVAPGRGPADHHRVGFESANAGGLQQSAHGARELVFLVQHRLAEALHFGLVHLARYALQRRHSHPLRPRRALTSFRYSARFLSSSDVGSPDNKVATSVNPRPHLSCRARLSRDVDCGFIGSPISCPLMKTSSWGLSVVRHNDRVLCTTNHLQFLGCGSLSSIFIRAYWAEDNDNPRMPSPHSFLALQSPPPPSVYASATVNAPLPLYVFVYEQTQAQGH